jgi:uncharacterized membrane protein YfcA
MWTTGLVLAAVVLGAGMQRITGMGFALVATPFLVLLLGPVEGVVLVNLCGAVTAGAIIFRVARDRADGPAGPEIRQLPAWHRYLALIMSNSHTGN